MVRVWVRFRVEVRTEIAIFLYLGNITSASAMDCFEKVQAWTIQNNALAMCGQFRNSPQNSAKFRVLPRSVQVSVTYSVAYCTTVHSSWKLS